MHVYRGASRLRAIAKNCTYADVYRRMQCMQTFAYVCGRMLTYADVCCRMQMYSGATRLRATGNSSTHADVC